jgi:hypothetical protein
VNNTGIMQTKKKYWIKVRYTQEVIYEAEGTDPRNAQETIEQGTSLHIPDSAYKTEQGINRVSTHEHRSITAPVLVVKSRKI